MLQPTKTVAIIKDGRLMLWQEQRKVAANIKVILQYIYTPVGYQGEGMGMMQMPVDWGRRRWQPLSSRG